MRLPKATAAVISVLAVCAATFVVGYNVGARRGTHSTSAVLLGADVLHDRTVLKMIERSDLEEARGLLNGSIDADVLQLGALLSSTNDESVREDIRRVLKVIADDRRYAQASHTHPVAEVDGRVKAILESVDPGK